MHPRDKAFTELTHLTLLLVVPENLARASGGELTRRGEFTYHLVSQQLSSVSNFICRGEEIAAYNLLQKVDASDLRVHVSDKEIKPLNDLVGNITSQWKAYLVNENLLSVADEQFNPELDPSPGMTQK